MLRIYTLVFAQLCLPVFIWCQLNNPAPYCSANYSIGSCESYISDVSLMGGPVNLLNQNSGCSAFADYYTYFCNKYAVVTAGATLTMTISKNAMYFGGIAAFADWNADNVFNTPAETIGASPGMILGGGYTFTFTVPPAQPNGKYRLRTRLVWLTQGTSVTPCGLSDKGETEDYDIYVGISPPVYPTATVTSNSPLCAGQTLSFNVIYNGTVAPTYSWSGPASFSSALQNPTLSNVTTTNAGIYTLSIGGGTCPIVKVPQVIVYNYPSLTVAVTPTQGVCPGGSATLNVSGANSYTWSNGSTMPQIVVSPTATAVYTVTGSNWGCNAVSSATVGLISGVSVAQSSPTICAGAQATLTASGANSYTWSTASNSPSIVVSPSVTAVYTVTADYGACQFSATVTQSVVICTALEMNSLFADHLVFPNPFSHELIIEPNEVISFSMFNLLGEKIIDETRVIGKMIIPASELPPGIYFIRVSTVKDSSTLRLIKN